MECPVCDADTPAAQPELPPERLLLSLSEAAEAMGVDADTVTKWGREAGLPLFRRGRVVRVYVPQLREWIGRQMERRR
jgi:excisionase family DNA binding protein